MVKNGKNTYMVKSTYLYICLRMRVFLKFFFFCCVRPFDYFFCNFSILHLVFIIQYNNARMHATKGKRF